MFNELFMGSKLIPGWLHAWLARADAKYARLAKFYVGAHVGWKPMLLQTLQLAWHADRGCAKLLYSELFANLKHLGTVFATLPACRLQYWLHYNDCTAMWLWYQPIFCTILPAHVYCWTAGLEQLNTNQWSYSLIVFSFTLGFRLSLILGGLFDGLTTRCTYCRRPEVSNVLTTFTFQCAYA